MWKVRSTTRIVDVLLQIFFFGVLTDTRIPGFSPGSFLQIFDRGKIFIIMGGDIPRGSLVRWLTVWGSSIFYRNPAILANEDRESSDANSLTRARATSRETRPSTDYGGWTGGRRTRGRVVCDASASLLITWLAAADSNS